MHKHTEGWQCMFKRARTPPQRHQTGRQTPPRNLNTESTVVVAQQNPNATIGLKQRQTYPPQSPGQVHQAQCRPSHSRAARRTGPTSAPRCQGCLSEQGMGGQGSRV